MRPCKVILGLFLFLLISVLAYCLGRNQHDFTNSECVICHGTNSSGTSKKVKKSVTLACLTCHPNIFEEGYMHPVDIRPQTIKVPIDFPLSEDGLMTCNTCHSPHASPETPLGKKSSFLRRFESGKTFCDICHFDSLALASGHQIMFRDAHSASKYTVTDSSSDIDPMSKNCISCHDGSTASSVELKAGTWQHSQGFIKFDKGGKHPIGMDYEEARQGNRKLALIPKTMVDERIRFFNGKLGCGTCHNPYSQEKYRLVITVNREQLCLSCHKF